MAGETCSQQGCGMWMAVMCVWRAWRRVSASRNAATVLAAVGTLQRAPQFDGRCCEAGFAGVCGLTGLRGRLYDSCCAPYTPGV